jgi:hypothetical protein
MSLAKLHHRRPRWLIGLLVLTLLGPGLVPVQGHTRLVTTLDGQVQTLCTWQDQGLQDSPEPWQSPAYLYAQLLGGAAFGDLGLKVSAEFHPTVYQATPNLRGPDLVALPHYAIRAPPLFSC